MTRCSRPVAQTALAFLLFAGQAMANPLPEPQTVLTLSSGERITLLSSVTRPEEPQMREVTILRVLGTTRTIYNVPGVRSLQMVYQLHCRTREWSITEVNLHADATGTGKPLQRFDRTGSKGDAYPPIDKDPIARHLYNVMCMGTGLAAPAAPPAQPAAAPASTVASLPPEAPAPTPTPPSGTVAAPAPTPAPTPVSSIPLSDTRPFEDTTWTLGVLANLAQYAYVDPYNHDGRIKALGVLERLLERNEAAGATDDNASLKLQRFILKTAIEKGEADVEEHERRSREKSSFLAASDLVEDVPAPVAALLQKARNQHELAGLRIEFYRHRRSGEHAIVFRGSAQGADWITNAWLGVDKGEQDAPYYRYASAVVKEFLKARPGANVVMVGHSLGGGLAQHIGNQNGFRVVAFNSSPLPQRYLGDVTERQRKRSRVYTAVYRDPNTGVVSADPLSTSLTRLAQDTLLTDRGIRANQHLVRPTCTMARPEPFYSEEERRAHDEQANLALGSPEILSKLGVVNTTLGQLPHVAATTRLSTDPLWSPVVDRHGLPTLVMGRSLLDHGGNKAFAIQSGLLSGGQMAKQLIDGRLFKLIFNLGMKVTLIGVRVTLSKWVQAHSMPRYARGLSGISHSDALSEMNGSMDPQIKEKCDAVLTLHGT